MGRRHRLSAQTVLSLEFQEYYALIRRSYIAITFSILSLLCFVFSAITFINPEGGAIGALFGILNIIAGVLAIIIIVAFYHIKRLLQHFDQVAIFYFGSLFLISTMRFRLSTAIHIDNTLELGVLLIACLVLNIRFGFAMGVLGLLLPPVLTSLISPAMYTTSTDTLMALTNGISILEYALLFTLGLSTQEGIERERYRHQINIHRARVAFEKQKTQNEKLLENMFPPMIRAFVENHGAQNFPKATVIFADLENFQELTASLSPADSITLLNKVFSMLDSLVLKYQLLKVKTTGEVYIAVSNVPEERSTAVIDAVRFSLDALEGLQSLSNALALPLRPRVGINTGFIVAGTLHTSKLTFDIYGDTVNVAHRMMHHGVSGAVQVSVSTLRALPLSVQEQVLPTDEILESPVTSGRSAANHLPTPRSSASAQSPFVANVGAELCTDWLVHPRGQISIKHHGKLDTFLISRGSANFNLDLPASPRTAHSCLPSALPPCPATATTTTCEDGLTTQVMPVETDAVSLSFNQPPTVLARGGPPSVASGAFSLGSGASGMMMTGASSIVSRASGSGTGEVVRRRKRAPSVSMSVKSGVSSDGTSTSASESSLEDVLSSAMDKFSNLAVLTSLQATMQQQLHENGEEEERGEEGETKPDGQADDANNAQADDFISPSSLAESINALSNRLRVYLFKDRQLFPIYFVKTVKHTRKSAQKILMLHLLVTLLVTVFQAFLIPDALALTLGLRLGVMAPNTLLCILLHKPRFPPLCTSLLALLWNTIAALTLIAQQVLVLTLYPISDSLTRKVFDAHYLSEVVFYMLIAVCPWIIITPFFLKIVLLLLPAVACIPVYILYGPFPNSVTFGAFWGAVALNLAIMYLGERNQRLSFLQAASMREQKVRVRSENERFATMLESTLPTTVLHRLKTNPRATSQRIPEATVFFADFVKFTEFCTSVPSVFVVQILDEIYACFDAICNDVGVMPIMTIGDCYFAGAGLVGKDPDQAKKCVCAALKMIAALKRVNQEKGLKLMLRTGMSTGVVFAGVLGVTRFSYDVWGPGVSAAKKLEAAGADNQILIPRSIREKLPATVRYRDGPIPDTFFVHHRTNPDSI